MKRWSCLIGPTAILVIVLALANSQVQAMGTNPKHRLEEENKLAFGVGDVHRVFEVYRFYHTSTVIFPEKADPAEMSYQFFELNRGHFPMKNVRKELVLTERNSNKLIFKQFYKEVPVDAGAKIWIDSGGNLDSFELNYYEIHRLSTIPMVNSATALGVALKDLNFPKEAKVEGPTGPEIFSSQSFYGNGTGRFYLVWTVRVSIFETERPPSEWVYYVNALDGSITYKRPVRR